MYYVIVGNMISFCLKFPCRLFCVFLNCIIKKKTVFAEGCNKLQDSTGLFTWL